MLGIGGDTAHLHFLLGNAYLDLYQNEQARAELEKAISLDPKLDFVHYNLGVVYQHMGMLQEVAKEFDTEMTITPHEPWSYENRGEVCLAQGQPDQAIKFYRQALARQPKLPKSQAGLGKAYVQKGETAQGIRSKGRSCTRSGERQLPLPIGPSIWQGRAIARGREGVGDDAEASGCCPREAGRPIIWESATPLTNGAETWKE